jgi:2-keto-4-pentenoate hydratase/2-oxohepta-3-ene-1,7-dioic acid hydratase in catechol pathway
MRLASVLHDGERRAAVVDGDRTFVTRAPGLDAAIEFGTDLTRAPGVWVQTAGLEYDAPLRPPVVFCFGQNYQEHVDEKKLGGEPDAGERRYPDPEMFLKAGQTISRPGDPLVVEPEVTAKLDYETELAVVIGAPGRHIPRERAFEHVYGYLVVNELGARDRQLFRNSRGGFDLKLGPGKNFDGAMRLAPSMVTTDDVPDLATLDLTTVVNGELRQHASIGDLIFDVSALIAYLSSLLTLQPGTVIATGAPGGTAWASDPDMGGTGRIPADCVPGGYLTDGDVVEGAISHVGELRFTVKAAAPR